MFAHFVYIPYSYVGVCGCVGVCMMVCVCDGVCVRERERKKRPFLSMRMSKWITEGESLNKCKYSNPKHKVDIFLVII